MTMTALSENHRAGKYLTIASSIALGFAVDFVSVNILKINILPVNFTAYCVMAITIGSLFNDRWKKNHLVFPSAISFFIGTLLIHFALANNSSQEVYAMSLASESPLTFRSSEWPQYLLVTSPKLLDEIHQHPDAHRIDVLMDKITSYGCIVSLKVNSIDGVDLKSDRESNWVWKIDRTASTQATSWPGLSDQNLFWCAKRTE